MQCYELLFHKDWIHPNMVDHSSTAAHVTLSRPPESFDAYTFRN